MVSNRWKCRDTFTASWRCRFVTKLKSWIPSNVQSCNRLPTRNCLQKTNLHIPPRPPFCTCCPLYGTLDNASPVLSPSLLRFNSKMAAASERKSARPGIIYLSRLPPFMKPAKVRHIFSQFGEVGRLFLQPEGTRELR